MNSADPGPRRPSLRRRLLLGLLGYVVLLSVAVAIHGLLVNEYAERLVWQTLLTAELDHLEEQLKKDPAYHWADTRNMALYDSREPASIPESLRGLAPGLHDDIMVDGRLQVVMVRQEAGYRAILTLDLSAFEAREEDMALTVVGSAMTLLLGLGLLAAWGANRLVQPLTRMARRIGDLEPDRAGQRLQLPDGATTELEVIAHALNDYLVRNDRFVERERLFIDMASHELRTPIAVIVGASDLALRAEGAPPRVRLLLDRIRGAAKGVQELITLLLVLARDPERLAEAEERIALDRLLRLLIEDHQHLTEHKDLSIVLEDAGPSEVVGPPQIVRAAIGNLLRNAIENSDRGTIRLRVAAPATVVIEDPGHGMSGEMISAIYSRIARGGGDRGGSGIGLDLIARLCEHLGWVLELTPVAGGGTRATLALRPADGGAAR